MAIPVEPLYENKYHGQLFGVLGIVGFGANLLILFFGDQQLERSAWKLTSQIAIGAWVLLPALWFFYEFFYFFPKHGNSKAGFERLKGVQEASSKVWAAVALVLAGIYSVQFP